MRTQNLRDRDLSKAVRRSRRKTRPQQRQKPGGSAPSA